jgi:hypothetical protein
VALQDEKNDWLDEDARKMKNDQKIERDSNVDVLPEYLLIDDLNVVDRIAKDRFLLDDFVDHID